MTNNIPVDDMNKPLYRTASDLLTHMDYKFWFIHRDDDGFITHCAIHIFEGEIGQVNKTSLSKKHNVGKKGSQRYNAVEPVNGYKRRNRLQKKDLLHIKDITFLPNLNGVELPVFTDAQFGKIKTDEELSIYFDNMINDNFDKILTKGEVK